MRDGTVLCLEEFITWTVLPEKDGVGLWDYRRGNSLHLLYGCPHGMGAPLDPPRLRGSVLDTPRTYVWLNPHGDVSSVPVCPQCFFHAYGTEVFSMVSTRQVHGDDRWEVACYQGHDPLTQSKLWHITSFYPSDYRTDREVCALEEVVALNGAPPPWSRTGLPDRGVCSQCFYQVFPELLPARDPLAKDGWG